MKVLVGIRAIAYLIDKLGFEGFVYFMIGLVIMTFINAAVALIPAGATKILSSESNLAREAFYITVVLLFIVEFIFF